MRKLLPFNELIETVTERVALSHYGEDTDLLEDLIYEAQVAEMAAIAHKHDAEAAWEMLYRVCEENAELRAELEASTNLTRAMFRVVGGGDCE